MTEGEDDGVEHPTKVGETVEFYGHVLTLKDPEGANCRKFHCERCGKWDPSARRFELEGCDDGVGEGRVECSGRACPNCGADEGYTVEVWEDKEDWDLMKPPDYVGCLECHTMSVPETGPEDD